jgi:predicted nucleic acid-binding protein
LFDIVVEPFDFARHVAPLVEFASAQNLTFYDAAYVQIAIERSIPLGTLDSDMRRAAHLLGIRLFPAAA